MEISILSEIFLEKCDFLGVNCLEKCKKTWYLHS